MHLLLALIPLILASCGTTSPVPAAATPFGPAEKTQTPAGIAKAIRAFFKSTDEKERRALAKEIEEDPGYDPQRMSAWMHGAGLYAAMKPGIQNYAVDVGGGHQRAIQVRIPAGYDPSRAWPVVYALHPSGGTGPAFMPFVVGLLGKDADRCLIVAPTAFRQTSLDAPPPENPENLKIWREVRETFHVDADRVLSVGFSLGAMAGWNYCAMYPDQFAGAILFSGTPMPIELPGVVEAQLLNTRHQRIVNAWGANDTFGITGIGGYNAPIRGTMAEANRRLADMIRRDKIDHVSFESPQNGHNPFQLDAAAMAPALGARRAAAPEELHHRFRYLSQSSAYWVQGTKWEGAQWTEPVPTPVKRRAESNDQAMERTVLELMGEIQAKKNANEFLIRTRHLASITVWLDDHNTDWTKPVTVDWNGQRAFEGAVKRDLYLCLSEAARTHDLDRLRWARISLGSN